MQVKGVANTIESIKFSDENRNKANPEKSETKEITRETEKTPKDQNKYTEEELIKSIEEANKQFIAYDRRFEFSIHDKTKQIMVKIIDSATDDVIREIPPEKILDLLAAIWEISGIIVDERI